MATEKKAKRLFIILNDKNEVTNVLSDVANLDVSLLTVNGVTEEGETNASVINFTVLDKTAKKDVDEIEKMIKAEEQAEA